MNLNDILHSACGPRNQHLQAQSFLKQSKNTNGCKTKEWINNVLQAFAAANNLLFLKEYRFDLEGGRRWRSDWALLKGAIPVALIEYEGIHSKKSRHTEKAGYIADAEKYNAASLQGFTLLRYTANTAERTLPDDLAKLKL